MPIPYHKKAYKQDHETGAFLISVFLDTYEDVFDDWDPTPFKKRDIEDEFLDFLWDSAEDIPLKEDLLIVFRIDEKLRDEKKEAQIVHALKNHFEYMLSKSKRAFRKEQNESLLYFMLGISFFLVAYLNLIESTNLVGKILEDGLFVGAWVFMWESFSNLFIESKNLIYEQRLIKRFTHTPVAYKGIKKESST
ncbi:MULTISPECIES: hypothetical protein [unclassified Fusibacter]|uniref:hypothetical protein n=1 Tax=unclassified Fusibacter TaxID=2624464 RepID=UPI0010110C0B|nr:MULTISPECIES: hypothetical protein [unclassified Fusibacter]MCK8060068.1 hypothetical protein [Fusibacter sp. A2]NPE22210.1 hypothetical protein [Fusibacter sp. A1]RXV60985.1 hypothetical protein DWB64_10220 [Fusibacter sp. A1]